MKKIFPALLTVLMITVRLQAIQVSGAVSGDWTLVQSPVEVIGNINIPAGQALTIEPGVEVIFQGQYKFDILNNAVLTAQGTVEDSILFTAQNSAVPWLYVYFQTASSNSILDYCIFEYGGSTDASTGYGAVTIQNCNMTVSNSTVRNNNGRWGAGIYCRANAQPVIENCNIHNNRAENHGGGIAFYDGAGGTITDCLIHDNYAVGWGGGIYAYSNTIPVFQDCNIYSNSANNNSSSIGDYGGGGMYAASMSRVTLNNCWVYDNTSVNAGAGGGICTHIAWLHLNHTVICNNTSDSDGGGIANVRTSSTDTTYITNCDIYGNSATLSGGGIFDPASYPDQTRVINSVVWENNAASSPAYAGNFPFYYSDVAGTPQGTGNINADPLFVDPLAMDFNLLAGSPCIDAGHPNLIFNDPDGTIGDIGVFYFPQTLGVRISPDTLSFDSTAIAETDTAEFYVVNLLNQEITVDSVVSNSASFLVENTSFSIPASDSVTVEAVFGPLTSGDLSGEAVAWTNGLSDTIVFTGYGEGAFYVSPQTLDFGTLLLGDMQVQSVWIINPTIVEITIDSTISTYSTLTAAPETFIVPAQDSTEVTISFFPDRNGPLAGEVIFYSEGMPVTVNASCTGYGFTIEPLTLSFGETGVGDSDTLFIQAINQGLIDIAVDSIVFGTGSFSSLEPSYAAPPADTVDIGIVFTPEISGQINDTGYIYSSAETYEISLSGSGIGWVIEPDTLDFGFVSMNGYDTLIVFISNFEPDGLTVDSLVWSNPVYIVSTDSFTVLQGETYELPVVIHSPSSGYKGDVLHIYTSNGNVNVTLIAWVFFSEVGDLETPLTWELSPVYPNPFNNAATIGFTIPQDDHITLSVWNILGEKITSLENGKLKAGRYHYIWKADNTAAGIYFVKLQTSEEEYVRKVILLK